MAYTQYIYRFEESVEYEYHYAGQYGSSGEKRAKRNKPTPEAVKRHNQKLKAIKVRRLIKANFKKFDYFITIKYPRGTRKALEEVQKDIKGFITSLRGKYKRRGKELKFIYRLEIGARGGIHCHMILPRIAEGDILIQDSWKHGRINFQNMYEDVDQLAAYMVKEPSEEIQKQLSLFDEDKRRQLIKYSSSRNLIRPQPEKKRFSRWTLRKIIEQGPQAHKGYYIDRSSVKCGISQWTGMSYLYYTEILIKEIR